MNSRNIGNLKIKAETCKHQPNFKITYTSDAFTRSTLRYHFKNSEKKKKELFKTKIKDIENFHETLNSERNLNADDLVSQILNTKAQVFAKKRFSSTINNIIDLRITPRVDSYLTTTQNETFSASDISNINNF